MVRLFVCIILKDREARVLSKPWLTFHFLLGVLFVIRSCLCSTEQDEIVERIEPEDQRVNLTCQLNSTDDVIWYLGDSTDIYNCTYNQVGQCKRTRTPDLDTVYRELGSQATRSEETSILSITPNENEKTFKCETSRKVLLRRYRVTLFNPNDIVSNCTVTLPSDDGNGKIGVALSCKVNSFGKNVNFTFEGIQTNIPDTPGLPQSIRTKTFLFDNFNNIFNASCIAYVPDLDITHSCNYPNIVKTQYTTYMNDIIVECDTESDVDWHLFDTDGREEDIKNRSWTRKGGRSLLILDVSERDVGKVVVCQPRGDDSNSGTITFTVISEISRDTNEANSGDSQPVPDDSSPFFVPTLLFLALWLITTAVCGVWFGCRHNRSHTLATRNASVPNAPSESNVNGGANDRETSLDLAGVRVRGDPDTSNTNNSASNTAFELQGEGSDENRLNRQSNNGSHLYFTLEKPSPSAESSRMASTSRIDRREDTNLASLNQPQSSHWQGYETVGESDKGAACSYDLGEYAEVGDHHIGRSLPDRSVRPSIPKKPGKEEITESDISKLYSQVNK